VRPPDDRELTADLTELRRTVGELQEASLGGAPPTACSADRRRSNSGSERRALRTPAVVARRPQGGPQVRELSAALG
jgi:hypothetical protein